MKDFKLANVFEVLSTLVIDLWNIMLSISFSLLVIGYYLKKSSLVLKNFKDRTIGIVVLSGIDAAQRTSIYVKMIIIFSIIFFVALIISSIFNKRFVLKKYTKIEKNVLFILSTFSIFVLMLYFLKTKAVYFAMIKLLYFLIILDLSVILIKNITHNQNKKIFNLFSNYSVNILSLYLPIVLMFVYWVFFNKPLNFSNKYYFVFIFLWIFFYVAYYIILKFSNSKGMLKSKIDAVLIKSCIPLILIPISIPVSNEIQYSLLRICNIFPRLISEVIIIVLCIISALLCIINILKKDVCIRTYKYIKNIYFPIAVATMVLFCNYQGFLQVDTLDLFHHGENLIATQQLFEFKSIPFVDIYPTQGFANTFAQMLFCLANGFKAFAPWLWSWIYAVVLLVLLYFLLKRIINPLSAIIVVLLLPIEGLVGSVYDFNYIFAIVPALALKYVFCKVTFKRFVVFWTICLLMLAWRVDFGIGSIVSAIFAVIILNLKKYKDKDLNLIRDLKLAGLSLLVSLTLLSSIFIVLILLGGESVKNVLIENYIYVTFQAPVQAIPNMIAKYSTLAVFQYLVLPSVAVAYICYLMFSSFFSEDKITFNRLVLVFLAAFSLILSIRSTQRHSLAERYTPYWFVFLAVCVPFFIGKIKKQTALIYFCLLFLMYIMVFPYDGVEFTNGTMFTFTRWETQEGRVKVNDNQYKNIANFIKSNTTEKQTFLDFTNSPLLYVVSNKKFTDYLIPNIYNASDPIQKIEIEKLENTYKNKNLPYVIFKQGNWWDTVDGVPNEIRSYRIAEFIYNNYKPYIKIDNYEVWIDKDINRPIQNEEQTFAELPLGNKDKFVVKGIEKLEQNSSDKSIIIQTDSKEHYIYNFLQLERLELPINKNLFLKVKYKSSISGKMQVYYSFNNKEFNGKDSVETTLVQSDQFSDVLIPINVSTNNEILSNIRVDPPENSTFELADVGIVEKDNNYIPLQVVNQNYSLIKLPYIWGTYDSKKAASTTKILAELVSSPISVTKNAKTVFTFDPKIDKSSGNYIHFRIKADKNTSVKISYGDKNIDSVTFDVIPSAKYEDYLIRISSQWEWMNSPVNKISLESSGSIIIEQAFIRKGD